MNPPYRITENLTPDEALYHESECGNCGGTVHIDFKPDALAGPSGDCFVGLGNCEACGTVILTFAGPMQPLSFYASVRLAIEAGLKAPH